MTQSDLSDYQSDGEVCDLCDQEFKTQQYLIIHEARYHREKYLRRPVPLITSERGYRRWRSEFNGEHYSVAVHQLLAIADGEGPHKVFSEDISIHHGPKIEHPLANIPGNVQAMESSKHGMHHNRLTESELIEELQRLATELNKTPKAVEMTRQGAYSSHTYIDRFGGWEAALEAAGLSPDGPRTTTDEDLLEEIRRVAEEIGSRPTKTDMTVEGEYDRMIYRRRFGSFSAAVEKAL